jgi:hypothetical protein
MENEKEIWLNTVYYYAHKLKANPNPEQIIKIEKNLAAACKKYHKVVKNMYGRLQTIKPRGKPGIFLWQ